MARVMFGGGVSAIRGSIAGQTFSKNANGAYIRNRSKPANRNTTAQQEVRNTFGSIARAWKDLTGSQQESFIGLVASYPYVNSVGESSIYTGFQLYQKANSQLMLVGLPPIVEMIPPVSLPATTSLDAATISIGATVFNLTATFAGSLEVPTGCVAVFEATRSYAGGTYRPKRQDFKQFYVAAEETEIDAINEYAAYSNVFGAPTQPGSTIFFRVSLVSMLTGQVSNPIQAIGTVVA
jgi:hypothetical protein